MGGRGTDGATKIVRRAIELATSDLLCDDSLDQPTAGTIRNRDSSRGAYDASLVGVFRALVAGIAAERGRDEPPFATGRELRDQRELFESLSPTATKRLEGELGEIAYGRLSMRRLGGIYERLLDCEPTTTDEGSNNRVRLTEDATQRASVGAYYTPEAVVEYVVSQAVDGNEDARVLDPAMGSGHFLTCAIDRLAELRSESRKAVAENFVFGMDVDPLAVELARSAVWLETGVWPDDALRVGDALVDAPEWPGGKFDAVVGNPPYVRSRTIPSETKADLKSRYDTAKGAFDLYVPFVERMAELGDRVACIVPNKWTTARYGRTLRDHLLDRHRLVELFDISEVSVFADASVYPLVVTVETETGPTESIRVRQADTLAELGTGCEAVEATETILSRSFVDRVGDRVIPVGIDPEFVPIAERLRRENDEMSTHVTQTEGIHTGNVRDKLVVDDSDSNRQQPSPDCERLVAGGDVSRYGVEWSEKWVRFDPELIGDGEYGSLRDREVFETEKLLLRDISERPVAAYDDEGLYALNTLYSVRSRSDLPLRYLLAVVNSTASACWFQQVYGGAHVSGGYLRFKPMFATRLPIPDGGDERDALVALTNRMRELRRERADVELELPDATGPRLGEMTHRVEPESMLAETTADRDGLRLGTVSVVERSDRLVFSATARHRATNDSETDSWGFAETDPIPALAFEGDDEWCELLRWFVPRAVSREAFAERAAKTISLFDRLESLCVPEPEDAREFVAANRRVAELEEKISQTDVAIDRLVCRAYGLSVDDIETIERLAEK